MKKSCGRLSNETLCWDCQNATRCSWADGIPVKGWEATPTIVYDRDGDFNSYIVTKCPLFKEDTKRSVTTAEIAEITGKSHGVIIYSFRAGRGGTAFVRRWLEEKGYKLRVFEIANKNGVIKREFIIDKLPSQK